MNLDSKSRQFRVMMLVAVLAALPMISNAHAAIRAFDYGFCNSVFSSSIGGGGSGYGVLQIGPNPFYSLMLSAMLLLLLMFNIGAFLYLIGSALRIDRLVRFGKTEIGEIVVTAIVVFIFLGSFQLINFSTYSVAGGLGPNVQVPQNHFLNLAPGTTSPDVFYSDCLSLANATNGAISDIVDLMEVQQSNTFFGSFSYGLVWANFGFTGIAPLGGLSQSTAVLNSIANVAFLLVGVDLGISVILGFFFAILPLFFYLGIVLRSFPWTRAAGGAFLGLFVGFYIVFPLLLYLLISSVQITTVAGAAYTPQDLCQQTGLCQGGLNSFSAFFPSAQNLGFGLAAAFVFGVIGSLSYILLGIIISFIISYDFMEAAGDLLGAPALSSSQTLRNVI